MTSCSSKVLSFKGAQCRDEISTLIEEIGEFKLALRALRAAMSYVHPWNKSVEAISSFFEQTEYCQSDTAHLDRRAGMLTSFCDYVLEENSNRWRAKEGFISIGEMKECWAAFLSTWPQAMLATVSRPLAQPKQPARPFNTNHTRQLGSNANSQQHQAQAFSLPNPYFDNICVKWNQGRCLAAPGTCTTKKGLALRHCCNFKPNPATHPHDICQQNHAAIFYHR
jgi:hypothetical protein